MDAAQKQLFETYFNAKNDAIKNYVVAIEGIEPPIEAIQKLAHLVQLKDITMVKQADGTSFSLCGEFFIWRLSHVLSLDTNFGGDGAFLTARDLQEKDWPPYIRQYIANQKEKAVQS